jgi:hypothetical protein
VDVPLLEEDTRVLREEEDRLRMPDDEDFRCRAFDDDEVATAYEDDETALLSSLCPSLMHPYRSATKSKRKPRQ